jgi:hypothetical protein
MAGESSGLVEKSNCPMPTDKVRDNDKGNRDKQLVAIVTPLYRFPLTPEEVISIRHLRQHLRRFDRYIIGPKSLPPEFADFRLKRFPKRFFESIQSYSKLLITKEFYRAFSNYEYILIYQTAWCFQATWRNGAAPDGTMSELHGSRTSVRIRLAACGLSVTGDCRCAKCLQRWPF